jgi:hypothetical protein
MGLERFELELLGGGVERRYRRLRPEIDAMPWGTLDPSILSEPALAAARRSWTMAAYQEHRTGVACAATLRALFEARAPLDLIALATRFPLDELVHVELCARLAMELGGGIDLRHDPDALVTGADANQSPLLRAAELVVRFFCVGEALSIPLLRGTWRAVRHPLPKAILGRIVRDEAAHGAFGWTFLDWAAPRLDDAARAFLAGVAAGAIRGVRVNWDDIRRRRRAPAEDGHALGWMESEAYLALAARSLEDRVIVPLAARGIRVEG